MKPTSTPTAEAAAPAASTESAPVTVTATVEVTTTVAADPAPENAAAHAVSVTTTPIADTPAATAAPATEPAVTAESLMTALLSPLAGTGSGDAPLETPIMWVALAAARRQIGADDDTDAADTDAGEDAATPMLFSALLAPVAPQLTVTGSVTTGAAPSGVAVAGNLAYVTNQGAGTVSVINTDTNTLVKTLTAGANPTAIAVSADGTRAYVTNGAAGTLSVIDVATNTIVKPITVGSNPSDVVLSADGTRAFVVNSGAGTVTKIDTTTNKVTVAAIKVGAGASQIALTGDGKYAYVANTAAGTVSVITLSFNGVKTLTGVGSSPADVTVSPDSTKAYIASGDGTITVVNTATNTISGSWTTGVPTHRIALSADGATLYAAGGDTVTALDTSTGAITGSVITDPTPDTVSSPALAVSATGTVYQTDTTDNALRVIVWGVPAPANSAPEVGDPFVGPADSATGAVVGAILAADPDGSDLTYTLTGDPAGGTVVLLADGTFTYTPTLAARLAANNTPRAGTDTFTVTVSDGIDSTDSVVTVPVRAAVLGSTSPAATGSAPADVAISGTHAYVANQGAGTVSVIDLATNTTVKTITVGTNPAAVALTPDGTRLYVANRGSNNVSVINTATKTVITTVKVGTGPDALVISPDGTRLFVANAGSANVTKIDTATNKVTVAVKVGNAPSAIAISPDGKYVYVTNKTDNTLSVITVSSNGAKTVAGVGTSPADVVVSPDNATVYVANSDGTVAVVNATTRAVTGHFSTAAPADSMALISDGAVLLVAGTNDTVTAIDTATGAIWQTLQTDPTPETGATALAIGADGTIYQTDAADNALRIITLAAVNHAPINLVVQDYADPRVNMIGYTAYAEDPDGDQLTYTATQPLHGVVTQADGGFWYTPDAGVEPGTTDSFVITATDPSGASVSTMRTYTTPPIYTVLTTIDVGTSGGGGVSFQRMLLSADGSRLYVINRGNYVGNGEHGSVSVIDTTTATTIATVTVVDRPYGMTLSSDGAYLYVANTVSSSVSIIDTATNTTAKTVPVGAGPEFVAFTPDGAYAYVTNGGGLQNNPGSDSLSIIDTASQTVVKTIAVGDYPYAVAFTHDGAKAYITNYQGNSVSVIDTATQTQSAVIPVGYSPWGMSITPDGNYVYVTNFADSFLSVIDTRTDAVSAIQGAGGAYDVQFSPDGETAYLVGMYGVTLVDTATQSFKSYSNTGNSPYWTTVDPNGQYLYTDLYTSNEVWVLDASTGRNVNAKFDTGAGPNDILVSPDGSRIYVHNAQGNSVTVVAVSYTLDTNHAPGTPTVHLDPASQADGAITGSVTAIDIDLDPLSYSGSATTAHGSVTVNTDGSFTYTPTPEARHAATAAGTGPEAATDSFTVSVTDGRGGTASTVVHVDLLGANNDPAFTNSAVGQANPNTGVITGKITAVDPDADTPAYAVTGNTTSGEVAINAQTGEWTYTPTTDDWKTADADATDSFVVAVTDGHTGSATTTVTVHIAPPPEVPNTVVDTIPTAVGAKPTFIVFNADGTKAYVSNQGNGTVSVIDTATREIVNNVDVIPSNASAGTAQPTMLAFGPNGLLYVTDKSGMVAVINPVTDTLASFIGTGTGSRTPIGITFANGYGYVGQGAVGEVYVFNATTGNGVNTIGVPPVNAELTASPDGAYVYLADQSTGAVSIISTATNTVVNTVPIGAGTRPTNIAFTNNGARAYVTDQLANKVTIIDTAAQTVIGHIPVGSRPIDIVINADDTRAYVTNYNTTATSGFQPGTVSVIDLTVDAVIDTIDVDLSPAGDAITPDGKYLYVVNQGGGISIIALGPTAVNRAPVAVDDAVITPATGNPVIIDVLGNDSDPDADALSVTTVSTPSHGQAVVNANQTVTYTPDPNYDGPDGFTYTISDGTDSDAAAVTVILTKVDRAPVINAVVSTPGIGNAWTVTVEATDVDSAAPTVTVVAVDPAHVFVTAIGDGSFAVSADAGWASANPGAQVFATATATDDEDASTTQTKAIGTINNAVAIGSNTLGQTDIPALPAGVTYTQVAAGEYHTVLLRSDGTAVAIGYNEYGQTNIPDLPTGITYTKVVVGQNHTVLLRSDGTAVAIGYNEYGQTNIPALPTGVTYTQAAAWLDYTILLRSDGTAVAVGRNEYGETSIPALPNGVTYTQIAAGQYFTVLLRSDGTAVATSYNSHGQTSIPALPTGVTYTKVAAGWEHTVLLRSDGTAVAVGLNNAGQTSIPVLPAGVAYTQAAAGLFHTVLLTGVATVAV